jgi:hypothetical protein
MTSFVTPSFPTEHLGVARLEAAAEGLRALRHRLSGGRGLASVLLSAMAAAVLVAAYQVMDTVQLLVIWTGAWLAAFAALALLAGASRSLAAALKGRLDAWSARVARARADERLWAIARSDARVMADLQAAMQRAERV